MRNLKTIVFALVAFLIIYSPLSAEDFYMFIGDTDGATGEPIDVAVNTQVDIPVYFMCGEEGMEVGFFNCSVCINNQYADYFDSASCYFDPASCVFDFGSGDPVNHWNSYHFDGSIEDAIGEPFDSHPGGPWDAFSMWAAWDVGEPFETHKLFVSVVPEIMGHFVIHIKADAIALHNTTCLLLAEGLHPSIGEPNAIHKYGSINYNVIMDFACYRINNMRGLTGIVTDSQQQPIEGAIVTLIGQDRADTTDANGEYGFGGIYGTYKVSYHAENYTDIQKNVNLPSNNVTRLDVEMCNVEFDIDAELMLWAGGTFNGCDWIDVVDIHPGDWINIPVYGLGLHDSVNVAAIIYPLGFNNAYIDSVDFNFGQYYYPLDTWDVVTYNGFVDNWQTDSLGNTWDSYSFWAASGFGESGDTEILTFTQGTAPLHLFTFSLHVRNDLVADGEIITDLLCEALEPYENGINMVDTLAQVWTGISSHYARFRLDNEYQYLPGDCNMVTGIWPPSAIGGDVTYLVGSFRGVRPFCYLDGFAASCDVNGDCRVTGSDVTYLVNYFRGAHELHWCENYPPAWQNSQDVPENPPLVWPGCD